MDFIISISSGATPDKKEAWKYYTDDKESGIPFLRVQNIKPDTTISNDFIYISLKKPTKICLIVLKFLKMI